MNQSLRNMKYHQVSPQIMETDVPSERSTVLFGHDDDMEGLQYEKVSPGVVVDRSSHTRTLHRHIKAVLDLTQLDQNHGWEPTNQFPLFGVSNFHHGCLTRSNTGKIIPKEGITRDSKDDDGQTAKIRLATQPLVEILRSTESRINDHQNHKHHKNSSRNSNTFITTKNNNKNNNNMVNNYSLHNHYHHKPFDEMIDTRKDGTRRNRSRAIAIKRNPRNFEEVRDREDEANTADYDWATWRLYTRIVEYRQKHPIDYEPEEAACTAALNKRKVSTNSSSRQNPAIVELEDHQDHYGDIFEFEL